MATPPPTTTRPEPTALRDRLRGLTDRPATGDVAVLGVAAVWGSSYAVMQFVNGSGLTVANFLFIRFALAALPLAIYLAVRRRPVLATHVKHGVVYGAMLFSILYLETLGVSYTSAANAGFLITFSVILVPIYARLVGRTPQRPVVYALSVLALLGCAALTLGPTGELSIRAGDVIVLGAAVIRGFQIFSFGRSAGRPGFDVLAVTMVELVVVAALSLVVSPFVGPMVWEQAPTLSASAWLLIAYLAVFGSTLAFGAQLFAARRTSATRVALLMSTEPVFAAVFAVLFRGDHLVALQIVGGLMIVVAAGLGRILERPPAAEFAEPG